MVKAYFKEIAEDLRETEPSDVLKLEAARFGS